MPRRARFRDGSQARKEGKLRVKERKNAPDAASRACHERNSLPTSFRLAFDSLSTHFQLTSNSPPTHLLCGTRRAAAPASCATNFFLRETNSLPAVLRNQRPVSQLLCAGSLAQKTSAPLTALHVASSDHFQISPTSSCGEVRRRTASRNALSLAFLSRFFLSVVYVKGARTLGLGVGLSEQNVDGGTSASSME